MFGLGIAKECRMTWISFGVGCFVGGVLGMMVMALASATGRASEEERMTDAYWEGRKVERQALNGGH